MHTINKFSPDQTIFSQMVHPIDRLPKSLYLIGDLPTERRPVVAIVGTRKPTAYGRMVGYKLAYELAKKGVIIVSGLALGMDAIAHKAALDAGGTTIAVMPSGLDKIYPATNAALGERILANGGALISEYPAGQQIYPGNFIARNRIVAGLADGLVVVEAAPKSGTLHTASFALDYGRPVMAVPGEITSGMSGGTNQLIVTGARLITGVEDILDEIGIRATATGPTQQHLPLGDNPEQTRIIELLASGIADGELLQQQSDMTPALFSQAMTMLEINAIIKPLGANKWALVQ